MRNYYAIIALFTMLCGVQFAYTQGANCASADPFCTDNTYTFPASTSTTSESGPDYGCLSTQPNPAWYFIQVANSGDIIIDLSNSAGVDIDFICWGPYSNLSTACSNLTGSSDPFCELFETYPCGNIVDCSYSTSATETCDIPGAVAGQYYMFLITNYSGVSTDIIAQTNGASTGSTDCSIVPPVGCLMDYFEANISACETGSTFSVSGEFTYTGNPGSGTVIVEVDNGTSTYTQTFNPPFVDGQTYTYNISGIPADGAASSITVYFSADPACSQTITYTAVADCSCAANIGTQTVSMTGQGTNNYVLCYGDQIDITLDGNYTPPAEAFAPPGPTYDPGIGWLVYSCPPSVGLTPSATEDVANDPCLLGVVNFGDFSDVNDLAWINSFPAGTFTDNTVYFVPITFYSMTDGTYSYVNTTVPCYDLGTVYAVQYLPEVTMTQVSDCATGEVTATINGGLPSVDGSQFTVVAGSMTPATASFVNTSCADGGDIVLGGLTSGQSYSFDVEDANGCTITVAGTMTGGGGATLTYPQTAYCVDEANPSPTVTGSASGTFSSTAGLSINSATGVINLAASTPGPYTVTYVGTGGACPPSATFNLTINGLPAVVAGPDQTVCSGTAVTLTGSGANSYSWDNGVSNGVPFTPASTNTYTVTGTSAAGCQNTDQVVVTVQPTAPPQFVADVTSGCAPLTVTFTNLSGGSNCEWDFGDGNTGTGCLTITHTFTSVGCYDITLETTSSAGCVGTATLSNYICVTPNPVASFVPNPSVLTVLNPVTQMVNSSSNATTYQWNFGDGSQSTAFQPTHEYPENPGSYTIELIAYSASGCTDTAYATVVITEEVIFFVPNTFTPDDDEFNQSFNPVFTSGFDPYDFNMLIFDRWGEIIFETNNDQVGWDGTYQGELVKDGTYTWKIEFKTSANDARKIAVGHVNVLR